MPSGPSSIPMIHVKVEEEKQLPQIVLSAHHGTFMCVHVHKHAKFKKYVSKVLVPTRIPLNEIIKKVTLARR